MRPHIVVVASPVFQCQACLHERGEQGLVQELIPQATIEAFNKGILHRLAGCDLVPANLGLISPAQNGVAGGVVGGLTAMPGALPTNWCDLRGVAKEVQRGEVQPFIAAMRCCCFRPDLKNYPTGSSSI